MVTACNTRKAMWQRAVGLLLVLWACWLQTQRCPLPDWSGWKDVPVTLSTSSKAGTASFVAPHDTLFSVRVTFPDEPRTHQIQVVERIVAEAREAERIYVETTPPFQCHFAEQGKPFVADDSRTEMGCESQPSLEVGSVQGQAGHKYTVYVQQNQYDSLLKRVKPVVTITYDPWREECRHEHRAECFWSNVFFGFSLLLTFLGGSRIPLRGWFRRTA